MCRIIQRKEKDKSKYKGNSNYAYLFEKGFKNVLFAKDVAQAFTAGMHMKPAKAKNVGNLVPGGNFYDKLFNDDNTPVDPRFYLFPYGVMNYSKNVLGHKNDDKLKASCFLYISIYFQLIMTIMKKLGYIDNEFNNFIECPGSIINDLDNLFKNENYNKKMLGLAERILNNFYKDSGIKKKIQDNLPKFLKSSIENDAEVVSIIRDKIIDEIEEIDLDEFRCILMNNN